MRSGLVILPTANAATTSYVQDMDQPWSPLTDREAQRQFKHLQKLAACVSDQELARRLEEQAARLMAPGEAELELAQSRDGAIRPAGWSSGG